MGQVSAPSGLELIWVNASNAGPVSRTHVDPTLHQVIRILPGQRKVISRSSSGSASALSASPVNDLAPHISFTLAKVVSREHAAIDWVDGRPVVTNLGSAHGTYIARRHAMIQTDGYIVEEAPLASLAIVSGVAPLQDGDLVEFGKICSRSDTTHFPVRCYVRFVTVNDSSEPSLGQACPRMSSVEKKRFSLIDDPLDSESDVICIDATSHDSLASPRTATSSTPACVVDLTTDDDDREDEESLSSVSESESSNSDDDSNLSFSESDLSVDPFDLQHVSWRHEIQEAAREQFELDQEACDARNEGDRYMADYKAERDVVVDSPATSCGEETLVFESFKPDASPSVELAKHSPETTALDVAESRAEDDSIQPSEVIAQEPAVAAVVPILDVTSVDPVAETEQFQTKKRKLHDTTDDDSVDILIESDLGSSSDASSSCSSSPSLSKRMRTGRHHHANSVRRATSRGRKVKAFLAKAVYATSLLSVGFLTGSLFTFKSMMNAAAAANAVGSGKQ